MPEANTLGSNFFCIEDVESSIPAKQLSGSVLSKESPDQINQNPISPAVITIHSAKDLDLKITRLCRLESSKSVWRARTNSPICVRDLSTYEAFRVDIRYLILSHTWGIGPKFLTLARENLDQFQQSIPHSAADFNQSFRDALRLTVELGYRYIWIDFLCIFQEKPGLDWAADCPRMELISSNPDLNLSASGMLGPPRRLIVPPTFSCLEGESVRIILAEECSPSTYVIVTGT